MMKVLDFYVVSTFRITCRVPNMAVFYRSLISYVSDMLLNYCINHFEMIPDATVITGITFTAAFHICRISTIRPLHFETFSASFLFTFVSRNRNIYRGADKSLARPTSLCILFDGENVSFDESLVIYINSTNIPPIMIINRIYETQNLLSL